MFVGVFEKYHLGWLPCATILFLLFIGNLGYGTVGNNLNTFTRKAFFQLGSVRQEWLALFINLDMIELSYRLHKTIGTISET